MTPMTYMDVPIDKVVANPPGPKPLTVMQDSASKLPVQDVWNFPKVPIPDTSDLLGEMHEFPNESYSKLSKAQEEAVNLKKQPIPELTNRKI
ncbi:hypothetical protein DSO57_1029684 [Entomophthora muscae]|uniref:Uncharacterized protein n=1 Tax=Entomophthora muscae TaxID=34485 RepID=A0ACC2UBX3_9FUNG|nr:hypothetical protein DSO57_1029684 [Entomophthora muscae]